MGASGAAIQDLYTHRGSEMNGEMRGTEFLGLGRAR